MKRRDSGFTLLEILLAIGILTTISAYTISTLSTQIEHRNRLQVRNAAYHSLHVAMARIYDDLRHVYISSTQGTSNALKQAFVWRPGGKLTYFTTQNFNSFQADTPQSNLSQVRYSIRDDAKESTRKQLWRTVDTNLTNSIEYDDVGMPQLLVDDLALFKVSFWDGMDWSNADDWDTTSSTYKDKLPKMAKIRLEAYQPDTEIEKQNKIARGVSDNDAEREKIVLETIVYLLKSDGQQQLKEPGQEYPWR
jgi:type II secretion system protein J